MTLLIALGAVLAGCIRWRTRLGAPLTHQPPQRQTTMVARISATHAEAAPAAQA